MNSVQFSSVAQSCPTLCDPMNCSTPGLPVHHQLPEFTQTHVHRVGDAIQPSHPLLSPSPPAPNPSQHQRLFQWVFSLGQGVSHGANKLLLTMSGTSLWPPHLRLNGLPKWLSGKEFTCQSRRPRFDPWVGKIPWSRKWQPTSVFLPGKSHGPRSLEGCSPWGRKELDMTERLNWTENSNYIF